MAPVCGALALPLVPAWCTAPRGLRRRDPHGALGRSRFERAPPPSIFEFSIDDKSPPLLHSILTVHPAPFIPPGCSRSPPLPSLFFPPCTLPVPHILHSLPSSQPILQLNYKNLVPTLSKSQMATWPFLSPDSTSPGCRGWNSRHVTRRECSLSTAPSICHRRRGSCGGARSLRRGRKAGRQAGRAGGAAAVRAGRWVATSQVAGCWLAGAVSPNFR
jgi:hypothetical protein